MSNTKRLIIGIAVFFLGFVSMANIAYLGFLGFVLAIALFVVSCVMFSKIDPPQEYSEEYTFSDSERKDIKDNLETTYKLSLLVLLAEVMKADDKQLVCEFDRVKDVIRRHYKTSERESAIQQFKNFLTADNNFSFISSTCNTINIIAQKFGYAKRELLMELLSVAYADDDLCVHEEILIKDIAEFLGISLNEYESIKALFLIKRAQGDYDFSSDAKKQKANSGQKEKNSKKSKKNDSKDKYKNNNGDGANGSDNSKGSDGNTNYGMPEDKAYKILGVANNATIDEIKKAYRALAIIYHPDKAARLGDEAIRQATESMKQINVAWDVVKMARGIK